MTSICVIYERGGLHLPERSSLHCFCWDGRATLALKTYIIILQRLLVKEDYQQDAWYALTTRPYVQHVRHDHVCDVMATYFGKSR